MQDGYVRGAKVLARTRAEMELRVLDNEWHGWYRMLETLVIAHVADEPDFNKKEFLRKVYEEYEKLK